MNADKISRNKSKAAVIGISLKEEKIIQKIDNDRFGKLVAKTWRDLIDPFVPYKMGQLAGVTGNTVQISPWEIWYRMQYAEAVYKSSDWDFSKEQHLFATDHWDEKAAKAGKKKQLYRTLNDALQSGRY